MIGDPSGRNATRPPLTPEQISANAETYKSQVFKVLRADQTEILFNSTWCDQLGAAGMIRLAAKHTVARMLERDDFAKRYAEQASHLDPRIPLSAHAGIRLGRDEGRRRAGRHDQKFNLLVGRELQKDYGRSRR
jgi:tyrosyl-tRNA synthetase